MFDITHLKDQSLGIFRPFPCNIVFPPPLLFLLNPLVQIPPTPIFQREISLGNVSLLYLSSSCQVVFQKIPLDLLPKSLLLSFSFFYHMQLRF